ncbi:hypothetical protein HUA74_33910 [Myxococcus sp. CA051A]|uniref:hypothetical protein n=1 Tax=Myxococcus sp. CA051A TaxID=2741739 RepID=UPI00157B9F83|nr:hypothetical protein [Myxococcus sp. CA051A]NTX65668.1 hypothetical protein [Myxococcus sp. CA051A]
MDWSLVFEFIRQRDPVFLSRLEGVPDAAIATLTAGRDVTLPGFYVEFLRRMGGSSNDYCPFGATQDHRFSAIAERLGEDDDALSSRFFPVALETDESQVALYDHYLDLRRAEDDDVPLVVLEQGVSLDLQLPVESHETFGERITTSVFSHFELRLRAHHEVVTQGCEGSGVLPRAVALLQRAGFVPVLPLLGRVACLQAGPLSVHAWFDENPARLRLRLGGDDPRALKQLADRLFADLHGARRPRPPKGPRGVR